MFAAFVWLGIRLRTFRVLCYSAVIIVLFRSATKNVKPRRIANRSIRRYRSSRPLAGAWIVSLGDSARSRILRLSFGCRREMSWPFFFPFHVKHFLQKSIFCRSKTAELQEVCPKYD
jgi:hypothetical protein